MRMQTLIWLVSAAFIGALSGCATGSTAKDATYASAAQQQYQAASAELKDDDYLAAIRKFNTLRNKFPYSKYAPLSELGIGDAYFEQEKFASAVEQYRSFLKLHPNHPQVAYADWRVALAFYKLMPDDWFLLPPAYERDLAKTRDAARELKHFADQYPNSKYTDRANKLLALARRRLADHELYVAKFYLDRDNPKASAMRLRYLLKNYAGLGLDPKALFLLARSYIELGEMPRAKTALQDLVDYHPKTELAAKAREYMQQYHLQ